MADIRAYACVYVQLSILAQHTHIRTSHCSYYADPDFVHVPVQGLISKEYAAARRTLINMSQAAQVVDAGTPAEQDKPYTGDTIYLTTADGEGNMVSLIQSNYMGFGSGLVVPGLGFALQNRGEYMQYIGAHSIHLICCAC